MNRLLKKEFNKKAENWMGVIEYVQGNANYSKMTYNVVATLYTVNSLGCREPQFYSKYTEKIC